MGGGRGGAGRQEGSRAGNAERGRRGVNGRGGHTSRHRGGRGAGRKGRHREGAACARELLPLGHTAHVVWARGAAERLSRA